MNIASVFQTVSRRVSHGFNRCVLACSPMALGAMMVLLSVSSRVAMAQEELRPPVTKAPPSGPKFIIYFVAILLVAGVVFAVTLRSKRTHQD